MVCTKVCVVCLRWAECLSRVWLLMARVFVCRCLPEAAASSTAVAARVCAAATSMWNPAPARGVDWAVNCGPALRHLSARCRSCQLFDSFGNLSAKCVSLERKQCLPNWRWQLPISDLTVICVLTRRAWIKKLLQVLCCWVAEWFLQENKNNTPEFLQHCRM